MDKRVLCYGDSNTWGQIPASEQEQYDKSLRWTGKLQKLLENNFEVIEEGLPGRTLSTSDTRAGREGRNGAIYLEPCLDSHYPIDIVVLMLGTNELKKIFGNSPKDIGVMIERDYVTKILSRKVKPNRYLPKLIIISPPLVDEEKYPGDLYLEATEKSKKLSRIYREIADRNMCGFIDGSVFEIGEDGVHLSMKGHEELAVVIAQKIKEIFDGVIF